MATHAEARIYWVNGCQEKHQISVIDESLWIIGLICGLKKEIVAGKIVQMKILYRGPLNEILICKIFEEINV